MDDSRITSHKPLTDGCQFLQNRLESLFEIVRILESDDLHPKNPLTVVNHRCGQSFDPAKLLFQIVSRHGKWIVNPNSSCKLKWVFHVPHGVEFESDYHQPSRAIPVYEALVTRHFLLARLAPCSPEVNQHHLSTKVSR